jgi:MFS family permease
MDYRLYTLPALAKGFSVFFFVLLPVFYAQKFIVSLEVGYIGALSIAMLVVGALVVGKWLHNLPTKLLLQVSAWLGLLSAGLLYLGVTTHSLPLFIVAYSLSGLVVGLSMSGVNVLIAHGTQKGDRFTDIARISMVSDVVRIAFPGLVVLALYLGGINAAIALIAVAALVFIVITSTLPSQPAAVSENPVALPTRLRHNRLFRSMLNLEFLDSFASSQLFVFLPILFLAKGYSIQNSLLLQTAIFIGYLSGRWLIGRLAKRTSGLRAVAIAELGMIVCIGLLLVVNNLPLLYLLTLVLGIFARGTSPVIKALAFDSLHNEQIKKGSAMHVVAGDTGSALGQLSFGILLAWLGVSAPFLASAAVAGLIILLSIRLLSPATERALSRS